jgi:glycosyltransferase involved in cell wall biosynthesis
MTSPSKAPRVSVIIPCYNTARFVAQALESVFAQSYHDYEVVVVNDGSPDTVELERALAPWANKIVYIKTDNNGSAAARNTGIRASRGELIALLDSDDVYDRDYLDAQVRALDKDPSASIVYPRFLTFGEGITVGTSGPVSPGAVTFSSIILDTCPVAGSVTARRTAFEQVGLFDASLRSSEDYDMWLRCVKSGSRIIYNDEALLFYRRRPDSLTADSVRICDSTVTVLVKMRTAVHTSTEERRILENAISRFKSNKLFFEGKRAFIAGDVLIAIDKLKQAYALSRNIRLRMILFLINTMPHIARTIYLWRTKQAK